MNDEFKAFKFCISINDIAQSYIKTGLLFGGQVTAEEQYMIEDVSGDDIVPASQHLRKFVQKLEGFSFLNYFTLMSLQSKQENDLLSQKPNNCLQFYLTIELKLWLAIAVLGLSDIVFAVYIFLK